MKIRSILLGAVLLFAVASLSFAQGGQGQPNVSPDEQNMAKAVMTAPDPAVQLKAAADFIKKYPKSTLRPRLARELAEKIDAATDPSQKVTGAQAYREIFKEPSEQELITPALIDGLVQSKRTDEAFTVGSEFVTRNPESLEVLIQLVSAGTTEAKNKNGKFVAQSLQYAATAIQLMEADKKPAWMDAAAWAKYKSDVLPGLHQSLGLLSLVKGDRAQSRASYTKAAELAPSDPFNYVMLAGIINDEYQASAKKYQSLPAGPAKDEELKKAQGLMDATIDAYAHAIALSEGNATLQPVRQQYLQDLEAYYKYRHSNSTAGMQELINKYKAPPKP
ncbi:MAG TPA: hypothetical protein VLN44_10890 [Pyrinomonadaceae bacterium]|nr:hypothetical protein [Pyrinomonadaceae bacterium]